MPRIVILHTNDHHNRLGQEQADFVAHAKRSEENVLLLDAGDAVRAGNIGWTPGGEPILRMMTAAGYDAMCIGNREFHLKARIFPKKIADAGFPVLSASIRRRNAHSDVFLPRESTTFAVAGIRVGVFGLTEPMIVQRMLSARFSDYLFDEPIETARRMAKELRDGVDLLVALSHVGLERDREIAQAVPALDAIVGGHAHLDVEEPVWVGGTPIVAAGFFARYLGRAVFDVDTAGARLSDWQLIPLPRR